MWVFGLLCLVSVTVALPAPQSSEIATPESEAFTNLILEGSTEEGKEDNSEEKKEHAASLPFLPIPQPPQLEPIIPPVIFSIEGPEFEKENYNRESSEDKEENSREEENKEEGVEEEKEKESGEQNKEEDKKPEGGQVILEMTKPSFLANLFSHLPYWPSFPSLPNLPFFQFFGGGERGRFVNPNFVYYPKMVPYRYVYVK